MGWEGWESYNIVILGLSQNCSSSRNITRRRSLKGKKCSWNMLETITVYTLQVTEADFCTLIDGNDLQEYIHMFWVCLICCTSQEQKQLILIKDNNSYHFQEFIQRKKKKRKKKRKKKKKFNPLSQTQDTLVLRREKLLIIWKSISNIVTCNDE